MEKETLTFKDIVFFILFLLLLAIPVYLAYQMLIPTQQPEPEQKQQEQTQDETNAQPEEEPYDGPHYEEIFKNIEGQMAYIAVPTNIKEENKPSIVVYSHGSNTTVTSDTDDEFIQDLQKYGELYTKSNMIFAASNQHGANWGSTTAINDTKNMINWIISNYKTSEKIYLLGFSMGGLPTMNFATTYPENILKIALLAPTSKSNEWNKARIEKLANIDIQIWHGTSDVNVPYYLSTTLVSKFKSLGGDIQLITLNGKTHWDLDTEYMQEILDYFLAN
ncbi:alpha/beta hydrolase [Candidatus Microgenomates bacterium]|nr:alpha/beta hydrolase [Candidatus Microgenomates bacterium]